MENGHDAETGEIADSGTVEHGAFRRSGEIAALFAAKAKAQPNIENAKKAGDNPAFHSKYAKLGAVCDACLDALAEQGISVWQFPANVGPDCVGLTTLLGHSSGQWIESTLYVKPARFDAQAVGSVITYLRRYSLMAISGVAPDDDDGNAAVSSPGDARPASARRPTAATQPSPKYQEALDALRAKQTEIDGAPDVDVLARIAGDLTPLFNLMMEGSPASAQGALDRLHERIAKREAALRQEL